MHLFSTHAGLFPSTNAGIMPSSHGGSIYTRGIGQGYKSNPATPFFGRTSCFTFTSTPVNMVFKATRGRISSEENQSTSYLKSKEVEYIHCLSSSVSRQEWQPYPIFLHPYILHVPSKSCLDGCSSKQKWWQATLGKVPNPVQNGHQRLRWARDETSQWRPLVSKNRLASKRNAEKKVSLDLCPGNI